jgi:hypothetical protein
MKIDVGPYMIWQEPDGCIVREVKPYEELHADFEADGFSPPGEKLPYVYKENVLIVTEWLGLWGWAIAEPWGEHGRMGHGWNPAMPHSELKRS